MPKRSGATAVAARCTNCNIWDACAFSSSPEFPAIAEERYYSSGYTVYKQRQKADYVYLVREGWLELSHHASTARSMTELAGPGTILGLVEVMTGTSFSVTARTMGNSVLEVVGAPQFQALLQENPSIALKMSISLSRRLQKTMHSFYDMAGRVSARRRLMRVFHEIAESCGIPDRTGIRIELPITVQILADRLGCSRQYTSKLIGNLKQKGFIDRKNGWFVVTPKGLNLRRANNGR